MTDDDKTNIIPFAKHAITGADFGPPTDLTKVSTHVLMNSIEAYGFECEAGPLQNCAEWQELCRRMADGA